MSDKERQELKEQICKELSGIFEAAITRMASSSIPRDQSCICQMNINEHRESHKKINEFFEMLGDTNKTIRRAIVNILVIALVGAMAVGLVVKAGWIKI